MGDLKVAEATSDLLWSVNDEDIARAVPRDPTACAVWQAVHRTTGRDARIYGSAAYVLLTVDRQTARAPQNRGSGVREGELAWHRFRIDPKLGRAIVAFDRGEAPFPAGEHHFRAPTPSQTLAAKARRSRATKQPGSRGPIATRQWVRPRIPLTSVAAAPPEPG